MLPPCVAKNGVVFCELCVRLDDRARFDAATADGDCLRFDIC
jgi:hypothetical protein